MAPQMETMDPFAVLGVADSIRRGSESPELFARIWKTFESHQEKVQPVATSRVYYGVTFPTADVNVTEYLAGMEVPAATPWPDGLEVRPIPGGAYAVFECSVDAIGSTYQHVFSTWLPNATVQFDSGRPSFEQYPENAAEKPVRLYIPVRQKPGEDRRAG
jgi:predicted transcriptional regulator YdeE